MRIIALETTEKTGGVAALDDGNLLAELMLEQTVRSAQSLAPAINDLLKRVGWLPRDVQLLGVAVGPGSFTGLRVGVTTAKVFAYAVGAEVLGVNTLEAIAAAAPGEVAKLEAVMDALRGEVVVQSFARRPDGWFEPLSPQELIAAEAWLARLAPGSGCEKMGTGSEQQCETPAKLACCEVPVPIFSGSVVTGPGLANLADRLPAGVVALDHRFWPATAAAVGSLAYRHYRLGRRDDLWKLVPHYCRRSAAEEKWDMRV